MYFLELDTYRLSPWAWNYVVMAERKRSRRDNASGVRPGREDMRAANVPVGRRQPLVRGHSEADTGDASGTYLFHWYYCTSIYVQPRNKFFRFFNDIILFILEGGRSSTLIVRLYLPELKKWLTIMKLIIDSSYWFFRYGTRHCSVGAENWPPVGSFFTINFSSLLFVC